MRGHLTSASCDRQNAISSCGERARLRRRRPASSTGCTTALTSSPKSSLGTPNTATSIDLRVRDEHVLGLLRVDVHAARDDHVRLAVGEVQEAVVVEVADVAERAPALAGGATPLVFSGSLWYSNVGAALEVDRAALAVRQLLAVLAEMCTTQPIGVPTVPGWASHSRCCSTRSRCPRCRRSTRG